MTFAIAGAVVLVAVLIAVWLSRSSGTPSWHDASRSEGLRALLASRGLDAQPAPTAPVALPDFRLPFAWGWRTRAGAQGGREGERWLVYDAEVSRRGVAGCNSESGSSGDASRARHTIVAVRAEGLALPHFTVVPNVRTLMREMMPDRFREAGLANSRMARFAMKASETLAALEEQGHAVAFPGLEDFEAAFRVTGDENGDVRPLFNPQVVRLLMQHPWAIVEGQDQWLAVSRNTAEAYRTRPEHELAGLLSLESTAEVLDLTGQLIAAWTLAPAAGQTTTVV